MKPRRGGPKGRKRVALRPKTSLSLPWLDDLRHQLALEAGSRVRSTPEIATLSRH